MRIIKKHQHLVKSRDREVVRHFSQSVDHLLVDGHPYFLNLLRLNAYKK
jgi:hypothetical protein